MTVSVVTSDTATALLGDSAAFPRYAPPMDEDRMFQHTTTLDQGANFLATKEGKLALLTPHDAVAEGWLRRHAGEEATWLPSLRVRRQAFRVNLPSKRNFSSLGSRLIHSQNAMAAASATAER